MAGSLTVISRPMGAGKTSRLVELVRNSTKEGKVYVPKETVRDGEKLYIHKLGGHLKMPILEGVETFYGRAGNLKGIFDSSVEESVISKAVAKMQPIITGKNKGITE